MVADWVGGEGEGEFTEHAGPPPVYLRRDPAEQGSRQRALRLLSNFPTVLDAARKLSAGDHFRVVMSSENVHFFKKAADGFYKPYLHNGKRFVENVNLTRVSPDYLGALSNIVLLANMAAISAKLDAIEVIVRNIERLLADTQRGRVNGALNALALARALSNPVERRIQMISRAGDLVAELGALTGQLRAHIAAMPEEPTRRVDRLPFIFGNRLTHANAAYEQVQYDVGLLNEGVRALLQTYLEVGEPAVAKEAVARMIIGLREANLSNAICKARLVRASTTTSGAPTLYLTKFLDAVTLMESKLLKISQSSPPPIVVHVTPEELLS